MKRNLLLILSAILLFPFGSKASHLMGGEVTAQHIGGGDYLLIATAYRDITGIPMASQVGMTISNINTGWDTTIMVQHDTIISGTTVPSVPYNTEIYIFADTFAFPSYGSYAISWENCCRNAAILNLANPVSNSMFLHTEVMVDSSYNSTPYFLAPPISYLAVNTPWTYNPSPFDTDGDSLVWSLDTPHTSYLIPCAGYTLPPDTSGSGTFSIDPISGVISYTASFLGNYVTTILVEEYRNGVKIGEIRRDMQIIVGPSIGSVPKISNFNTVSTNTTGQAYVTLSEGVNYQLILLAEDNDTADQVLMSAFGAPINIDGAIFSTAPTGNGNEISGTFDWTPSASMISTTPYILTFRVSDNVYAIDETILFEVSAASTGIFNNKKTEIGSIYPNPANGQFIVPLNITNNEVITVDVYNIMGNKVQSFKPRKMQIGNHLMICDLELSNGQYFVSISSNNKTLSTQKIIIMK